MRDCTQIKKGGEILLDYYPGDRTAETARILQERRKIRQANREKPKKCCKV